MSEAYRRLEDWLVVKMKKDSKAIRRMTEEEYSDWLDSKIAEFRRGEPR